MAGYSSRFSVYLCAGRRADGSRRNRLLLLGLRTVGVLYRPGGGGYLAPAPARTVHGFVSQAGARGGHRLAGVDLDFRHRRSQSFFSVLRFRAGCGCLSLGRVGNSGHGRIGNFAVVAGEPRVLSGFLWRRGPSARALSSAAVGGPAWRFRAQAPFQALDLSVADGPAPGVSGGTAKPFALGERPQRPHPRAGSTRRPPPPPAP